MTKAEAESSTLDLLKGGKQTVKAISGSLGLSLSATNSILSILLIKKLIEKHGYSYRLIQKNDLAPVNITRILMGIIGVVAIFISGWYTTYYLTESNYTIIALLMSIIMVVFSTAAIQLIVLFYQKRLWGIVALFCVLWAIVVSFSIGSTTIGQYNKWVNNSVIAQESNIGIALYSNYTSTEESLNKQIKTKQDQLTTLNTLLNSIDTMEKRVTAKKDFDNWNWQVTVLERDIKVLNNSLLSIGEKKETLLKDDSNLLTRTERQKVVNAYDFIAGVTGLSADFVHFILLIFPAIAADILAPVGIASALFLKSGD